MLLMDEVHVVPAHMFRKVLDKTQVSEVVCVVFVCMDVCVRWRVFLFANKKSFIDGCSFCVLSALTAVVTLLTHCVSHTLVLCGRFVCVLCVRVVCTCVCVCNVILNCLIGPNCT